MWIVLDFDCFMKEISWNSYHKMKSKCALPLRETGGVKYNPWINETLKTMKKIYICKFFSYLVPNPLKKIAIIIRQNNYQPKTLENSNKSKKKSIFSSLFITTFSGGSFATFCWTGRHTYWTTCGQSVQQISLCVGPCLPRLGRSWWDCVSTGKASRIGRFWDWSFKVGEF